MESRMPAEIHLQQTPDGRALLDKREHFAAVGSRSPSAI